MSVIEQSRARRNKLLGGTAAVLIVLGSAVVFVDPDPAPTKLASDVAILADGFEGHGDPGAPVDPCAGPLVKPDGFAPVNKTWAQAFTTPRGVVPIFPNAGGSPVPIGANKGTYLVVSFTATADTTVDMTWDTVQSQPSYAPRPADSMAIVISACPGDFRVKPGFDPCARVSGLDSMFWTTRETTSTAVCKLVPGMPYFYNIAPINPTDGIEPGEHTCQDKPNSANGCDVQIRHTAT